MFFSYLRRGVAAGAVAGLAFGAFVAFVVRPLVAHLESLAGEHGDEHGHGLGSEGGAGAEALLSGAATDGLSVVAGVLFGVLLGALVFGIGYYFLEPAIPGRGAVRSYLLGGTGFAILSGAPWLAVPPRPPEVAHALPIDVRLRWYGITMVCAAVACPLAGYAYVRLSDRNRTLGALGAGLALGGLAIPAALAPGGGAAEIAPSLAATYRGVVVFGQLGLWFLLATVHALLHGAADGRADDGPTDPPLAPSGARGGSREIAD